MILIDPKIMAFRRERANDLEQFALFTDRKRVSIGKNEAFKEAVRLLKDNKHVFHDEHGEPNPSLWGYTIKHLPVLIPDIPRHTFPAVRQLSLRINIALAAEYQSWQKMQDPTRRLNLDVILLGTSKDQSRCLTSYHLDKHLEPTNTTGNKATILHTEIHPLYHVQFNSGKIRKEEEAINLDLEKSGNLFLDTPRLLHHPMDLILGFDFLMANYFPKAWNDLQRDGHYTTLCRKYQTAFWKPYIHAIARHWNIHNDRDCWSAKQTIWPNLL